MCMLLNFYQTGQVDQQIKRQAELELPNSQANQNYSSLSEEPKVALQFKRVIGYPELRIQ